MAPTRWLPYILLMAIAGAQQEQEQDALYRQAGMRLYQAQAAQPMVKLTHQEWRSEEVDGGDNVKALRWFEKAVLANPNNAVNHAYVGNVQFRMENFEAAESSFLTAISLAPTEPRYLSNLGSLYAQRGRYSEAMELLGTAKRLAPEDGTLSKNYDSTEMFWRFEEMVQELKEPEKKGHWDLQGFLQAMNYSEKVEVTLKFVMEQRPDLHDQAIGLFRTAHEKAPDFAIMAHLLANTLVEKHRHTWEPGSPAPLLDEAQAILRRSLQQQEPFSEEACLALDLPSKRLHVVSVSSSDREELARLRESAEKCGFEFTVLGLNEPWRGLGSKIDYLTKHIENVAPNDILLFLDAYDVLMLPKAAGLVEDFLAFEEKEKDRVIFGAEINCAPDAGLRLLYPPSPTRFKFLNSGTFLGRVKIVRRMLTEITKDIDTKHRAFPGTDPWRFDDQRWYSRYFLAHPQNATLDTGAKFFQTLHDLTVADFDVEGQELSYKHAGSLPHIIHGNGNGIETFHSLSRTLGERGWPSKVGENAGPFRATSSPLR